WRSAEKERVFQRSSDRVLSKALFDFSKEDKIPATELMSSYEEDIDIPTFIRKKREEKV
ncbi:MAG: hypothetical protein HQK89_01420, partial [Nitrospirae bacterium]|nr:hypothetical protein [Nitrospirota bacterium]